MLLDAGGFSRVVGAKKKKEEEEWEVHVRVQLILAAILSVCFVERGEIFVLLGGLRQGWLEVGRPRRWMSVEERRWGIE